VDGRELRRRVRRANGNPFVRSIVFRDVRVHPRDQSWWASRERRSARLHLTESDLATWGYLQELQPAAARRLTRLLAELLQVNRVELAALEQPGRTERARRRLAGWRRHWQALLTRPRARRPEPA
jgi:hypothetical protein